jgi:hypothetical protein
MAIADRQPAVEPLAGSSKEAHMNEFSRKRFVQGGGALVVGFAILGAGVGAKAAEATGDDQFASDGPYDPQQLDSWLVIHADNTVSVKLGKVEFGQGANTGLLMIAAEELDLDFSQVRRIINDTELTPNQGITASSSSIQEGGKQTRAAAAAAKLALLRLASAQLGVDASTLSVSKGVVSGAGKTLTYGQLIGDKLFNVAVPASYNLAQAASGEAGPGLPPGAPGTKPVSQYGLVGKQSPPRIDIPAKVTGTSTYVQNIRIPGMLHARVVRPRGQGAYGAGTAPGVLSVDERSVAHLPDVRILRKGNFLAVAAPLEWIAIQAAAQLKVKWADRVPLPGVGNLFAHRTRRARQPSRRFSRLSARPAPLSSPDTTWGTSIPALPAPPRPSPPPSRWSTRRTSRSARRALWPTSPRAAPASSQTRSTPTAHAVSSRQRSSSRA